MDFIVPYDQIGISPPGPWQNASPAAGQKGSIVNADVFPATQNEILNVIKAANLTPDSTNLSQLLAAIKILIPAYAPGAPGVTSKGGLAKDGGGNFLLALGNLNPDGAAITGADILALQRASDGTLLSGTIAQIASFILAQQGATANGGLAKDGSGNFGLSVIANLLSDNRNVPSDADSIPLGRAADGAMIRVPASKLASYVLSNIVATQTFQQVAVNPVLYVDANAGNDSNNGLTSGTAFRTVAQALNIGTSAYSFASSALTINCAAGTYTAPQYIPRATGTINIVGAGAGTTIFTGAGSAGTGVVNISSAVNLSNLTIQNTGPGSHVLALTAGGLCQLTNVVLASMTTTTGAIAYVGGALQFNTGCSLSGNASAALWAQGGQIAVNVNTALAITGTPTFATATALALNLAQIVLLSGATITGSVSGPRYNVQNYSVITTNGAGPNAFPGSSAGYVSNGLYS